MYHVFPGRGNANGEQQFEGTRRHLRRAALVHARHMIMYRQAMLLSMRHAPALKAWIYIAKSRETLGKELSRQHFPGTAGMLFI